MKYVVDTNIVNWLIDGKINDAQLPSDGQFVATHIQIEEINKTADEDRRARLFITLASSLSGILPTETAISGISREGLSKAGDGALFSSIKNSLDSLNNGKHNNINDALIAEASIVNSHTLLTADSDLAQVTKEHGGLVRLFELGKF